MAQVSIFVVVLGLDTLRNSATISIGQTTVLMPATGVKVFYLVMAVFAAKFVLKDDVAVVLAPPPP